MVTQPESPPPLPQDLEAEKCVLGAVLLKPALFDQAREILAPGDFTLAGHRSMFEYMGKLADGSKAIDLVTLAGALEDAGQLEACGGRPAISALIDGVPRLDNLEHYARRVKDKARARSILRLFDDVRRMVEQGEALDDVLAAASDAVDRVRGSDPSGKLRLRPLAECSHEPEPEPLLRRAGDRFGSVLAVGEVAVLSGAGKAGKSTLALQVALGAAGCPAPPDAWQEVLGLEVRSGPVAVVSFEDDLRRIYDRSRLIVDGAAESLHAVNARGFPLFGVREGEHIQARPRRLPAWFTLWAQLRCIKPRLVVVDPVGSAFLGNSASVEAVRAFIDALRSEAERAECGVLLIAHATKGGRGQEATASDPGQVAGSAAWSDAARAVMVLRENKLTLAHANYSDRFTVDLEPMQDGGRFLGFRVAASSGVDHGGLV